jgi:hypothetical protein
MSLRNGRQSSGFSLERVRLRRTLGQRFNHFGPCRCSALGNSPSSTVPLRTTFSRLRFMFPLSVLLLRQAYLWNYL